MAAGTLFLGAPQIGYIAGNEVISLGLGLVAFCFPLHLLAAALAFFGRDAVAGLASAILAGVWLVAGIEMLKGGTGDEGSGLGLFYTVAAVLLLVPAVGVALGKVLPAVVIVAISVRFLLTGLYGLTGIDGFELAAGLTSPAVALLSLYVGLGLAPRGLEAQSGAAARPARCGARGARRCSGGRDRRGRARCGGATSPLALEPAGRLRELIAAFGQERASQACSEGNP